MNCSIHAATAEQRAVRGVDDCVNVELGNIAPEYLYSVGHNDFLRNGVWRPGGHGNKYQLTASAKFYSHLKAAIGSPLVARRAGIYADASATPHRTAVTTMKVPASVGSTPYNRPLIRRARPSAPPSPAPAPTIASVIACPKIRRRTSARPAPKAILMPISCVRRETE